MTELIFCRDTRGRLVGGANHPKFICSARHRLRCSRWQAENENMHFMLGRSEIEYSA